MHIYTLRCELLAPVAVRDAFAIFEDPYNLIRVTPPWLDFRVTSPERVTMRRGAEIEYQLRWLGLPLKWKTVITEYEPPFLFVDEEAKGPYALWRHRHTFHPTEQGTILGDQVEYALPFGWAGRMVNRLIVAEQLRKIFRYRQHALAGMLGGGVSEILEPVIS